MSSNKSIVSSKKTITRTMFSSVLKKNNELNGLKSSLNNNRIRCKLLWYTLIKLNQQIDNFEELYGNLDVKSQEKLIEKLQKETFTIYEKYIECGEIDADIDYEIEELIDKLQDKYNIVDPPLHIMNISKNAMGITRKKRNDKLIKHNKKHKKSCKK